MESNKDVVSFIAELDEKKNFFHNVNEINKYNMGAIVELIQYQNIKEYGESLYTREEIRRGIKKYTQGS
ncbi:hypothetical protein [Natronincola ferrireducens]|uniref:Uncharacterized protein n=1 Tax=Natronincola ferrireducens TaxID=393762 RepID=A0A1G8YIY9_9FIRM|nr:hypothetical protein [Natronincola ferrireducens]SDK02617.1 hypothetical protein SAMN05660472_00553 [Natronincola ferrireducens]